MGETNMDDEAGVVVMRHKLTADAYYRMAEAGILGADNRVELIGGEIIDMAPIGQNHAGTVISLNQALVLAFAGGAFVSVQNPIHLDDMSEPQPDFAVLRYRADFYRSGERPRPADVLLLIEVADSSLRFDRVVKLPLYARADIAEVWIADLRQRVVDVHRAPRDGRYTDMTTIQAGGVLIPSLAPQVRITFEQVFG